jgi:hypothetical protein
VETEYVAAAVGAAAAAVATSSDVAVLAAVHGDVEKWLEEKYLHRTHTYVLT